MNFTDAPGTGLSIIRKWIPNKELMFKKIKAGSNITLTESEDAITLASSGGGGGSGNTYFPSGWA